MIFDRLREDFHGMRTIPDSLLMKGLKEQSASSILQIYKEYLPIARSIVEKNSGSQQDAEDVFQDSLVILYKQINENEILLNCSLKTYFYSICFNIWRQRLDRKWRIKLEDDMAEEPDELYDILKGEIKEEELEKKRLFHGHFLSLPSQCQQLLLLFLHETPLRDIAMRLGLKNEEYAKTRKYMCKNMLRSKIIQDPRCKSYLIYD